MKSRKASVELSVNFLVTFIITIVVFGLGILLARQIFSGSESLADKTFEDLDKQIGSLVCSGNEKICLSAKQRTIERGAFGIFGLTVQNVFDEKKDFLVMAESLKYIDGDQLEHTIAPDNMGALGILPRSRILSIDAKQATSMGIGFEVPEVAPSGVYVIDIGIFYGITLDETSIPSSLDEAFRGGTGDLATLRTYDEHRRKIYVKVP